MSYRLTFMYPVRPFKTCFKCVFRSSLPGHVALIHTLRSTIAREQSRAF